MKAHVRSADRWVRCDASIVVVIVAVVLTFVSSAEAGIGTDAIDALYNLRDQNQDNANKSIKGVAKAMQEPPPDPQDRPWNAGELEQIRNKNANLLKGNNDLAHNQREWLKTDQKILDKLDPKDPRAQDLKKEMKQIADGLSETVKQQEHFRQKLTDSNTAIDRFKQANDPTYVPPKKTTVTPPASAVTDSPPEAPPESPIPNDVGSPGNDLEALKQKEAAQEAQARTLGKQREAAVNKYLDDPSEENHAAAEAARQQLDGMVDDLNAVRGQVDGLEGTSRPPLHVRSAKGIAEEHRRKKANGTNTDGTETQSGSGGGCAFGSDNHQPNGDGSDTSPSKSYEDVGMGGGGGGSGGGGKSNSKSISSSHSNNKTNGGAGGHHHRSGKTTQRKTQSRTASSQSHHTSTSGGSHHHATGGTGNSKQHTMSQQKKNPQQQQQRKRQNKQI